ncbi:MAG: terminase large subunit, partial [Planctomycetota bacterium]
YCNEANLLDFNTYYQLAIRTDQEIYLDYNPTSEFWAHSEVIPEPDSELLILTYKDNEALSDTIVNELESAKEKARTSSYWANWYKVYGLGQVGQLQGVVFENWKQIPRVPDEAKLIGYGLDWGYTNDPTAVVGLYKYNGKLVVDEVLYETRLTNKDIAIRLNKLTVKGATIIGDSAEPKSIDELYNGYQDVPGLNIYPAVKGPDSIRKGIDLLQQYEILVTEQSTNVIKELRGYQWDQDRTGKKGQKPSPNCTDHALDSLRYIATSGLSTIDVDYTVY